jgi:hypothetical protein
VAVLVVVGLMAIPSVRAIANNFLGLFRVQQIAVVQVDPGNLPEGLGTSDVFQEMLAKNVSEETFGEPQILADRDQSASEAGFRLRLPQAGQAAEEYRLQPASRVTFEVDLPQIERLLTAIGLDDIALPRELDEAEIVLDIHPSVVTSYGTCPVDQIFDDRGDPESARFAESEDCLILTQTPGPTITAPDNLNLPELGKAFLQAVGLSAEEAEEFSRTVDWTTTLVIPIPRYGAVYETVEVDGVEGTLIRQEFESHQPGFLLIWVKDGIVYSITGRGEGREGLELANSLD